MVVEDHSFNIVHLLELLPQCDEWQGHGRAKVEGKADGQQSWALDAEGQIVAHNWGTVTRHYRLIFHYLFFWII